MADGHDAQPSTNAIVATLRVRQADDSTMEVELRPGVTTIGRGKDADITLKDTGTSRLHAEFTLEEDGSVHLRDLGSANGTRVAGEVIEGRRRLEPGEKVRIGRTRAILDVTLADLAQDAIPGYRLGERVGEGALGVVYRATHLATDSVIAVKVIHPDLVRDPAGRARLLNAARSGGRIDHPNVMPVIDSGVANDLVYIASPWAANGSLADLIGDGVPLPSPIVAALALDAARGLAAAADHGVIHHNLRPGDLLIDKEGMARIADLGLASAIEDVAADDNPYRSSEELDGEAVDAVSNQFTLGAMIFHALAGRPPFESAEDRPQRDRPAPPISRYRSGVPVPLQLVVTRLLAHAPSQRYRDWSTVIDELERALDKARPAELAELAGNAAAKRPTRQAPRGRPGRGAPPPATRRDRDRMPPFVRNMLIVVALLLLGLIMLAVMRFRGS